MWCWGFLVNTAAPKPVWIFHKLCTIIAGQLIPQEIFLHLPVKPIFGVVFAQICEVFGLEQTAEMYKKTGIKR